MVFSMAEIDPDILVYTAIREVLENYEPFTVLVPVGNRVWFDDAEGLQEPEKEDTTDGDFHESILWPVSGEDSLRADNRVFDPSCSVVETINLTHRLELTSPWVGIYELSKAGQRAIRALRLAGWNLGKDFIKEVRVRWTTEREVRDDTQRWTHRIDISTVCEFENDELLDSEDEEEE